MFYRMYLAGICNRRQWPDPYYEPWRTHRGYFCKVRVNNREYQTDVPYETEALARDNAAMKAFMICRNFSVNDGMFPGQRPGQRSANGIVQGIPVAIGGERKSPRYSTASMSSDASSSGGSSPQSGESGFAEQLRQYSSPEEYSYHGINKPCSCGRGLPIRAYHRCDWCLTYL